MLSPLSSSQNSNTPPVVHTNAGQQVKPAETPPAAAAPPVLTITEKTSAAVKAILAPGSNAAPSKVQAYVSRSAIANGSKAEEVQTKSLGKMIVASLKTFAENIGLRNTEEVAVAKKKIANAKENVISLNDRLEGAKATLQRANALIGEHSEPSERLIKTKAHWEKVIGELNEELVSQQGIITDQEKIIAASKLTEKASAALKTFAGKIGLKDAKEVTEAKIDADQPQKGILKVKNSSLKEFIYKITPQPKGVLKSGEGLQNKEVREVLKEAKKNLLGKEAGKEAYKKEQKPILDEVNKQWEEEYGSSNANESSKKKVGFKEGKEGVEEKKYSIYEDGKETISTRAIKEDGINTKYKPAFLEVNFENMSKLTNPGFSRLEAAFIQLVEPRSEVRAEKTFIAAQNARAVFQECLQEITDLVKEKKITPEEALLKLRELLLSKMAEEVTLNQDDLKKIRNDGEKSYYSVGTSAYTRAQNGEKFEVKCSKFGYFNAGYHLKEVELYLFGNNPARFDLDKKLFEGKENYALFQKGLNNHFNFTASNGSEVAEAPSETATVEANAEVENNENLDTVQRQRSQTLHSTQNLNEVLTPQNGQQQNVTTSSGITAPLQGKVEKPTVLAVNPDIHSSEQNDAKIVAFNDATVVPSSKNDKLIRNMIKPVIDLYLARNNKRWDAMEDAEFREVLLSTCEQILKFSNELSGKAKQEDLKLTCETICREAGGDRLMEQFKSAFFAAEVIDELEKNGGLLE